MGKVIIKMAADVWEVEYRVGNGKRNHVAFRETLPANDQEEAARVVGLRVADLRTHYGRGKFVPAIQGGPNVP